VSNNEDVGYEANNTYESASDLCGDLAVNAAMGDKNNTSEDSVASYGNKKNPTEDSVSYSQNNSTEDCVTSNNDDVGYEANNTYESASDPCGNLAVNAAMDKKITQQSIVLQALATNRTPQRIVQALLKTTQQKIMS
jgi:hypothetical protein